jgi:hypothetical protein
VVPVILTHELARERTRDTLELAKDLRTATQLRALNRARQAERKAERRLIEAWQARDAIEATFSVQ